MRGLPARPQVLSGASIFSFYTLCLFVDLDMIWTRKESRQNATDHPIGRGVDHVSEGRLFIKTQTSRTVTSMHYVPFDVFRKT